MYYINAAQTICNQPSFNNKGFSSQLTAFKPHLIKPDFKEYIQPALIRRMSEILRMSVVCSVKATKDAAVENADAIIVGTGLGCLFDTEKFLNHTISITNSILPPTAFIQSTHNTIAGQISLVMGNHHYNMTHTQNALSFEHAMLDAMLMLDEKGGNLLIGAADEAIEQLHSIVCHFGFDASILSSGVSFFVLSDKKNETTMAALLGVYVSALTSVTHEMILAFLSLNNLSSGSISHILHNVTFTGTSLNLTTLFPNAESINYANYCGIYPTHSAFAMHLAADMLNQKSKSMLTAKMPPPEKPYILIVNQLLPERIGLILLTNEA
jgi:hypothetical protein